MEDVSLLAIEMITTTREENIACTKQKKKTLLTQRLDYSPPGVAFNIYCDIYI